MKTVLVTGATGFVGSHLVKTLLQEGWKVHVIVRPSSNLFLLDDVKNKLSAHDYNGSMHSMFEILEHSKPDVVFHVASLFLSSHEPNQIDDLIQSNITFGTYLLEAMSHAGVSNIINTSTSWEHYENQEYNPVNLYAATKKAFQDLMEYYIQARGVRAITLKLFDTYGENDPRPKLLNFLLNLAETGEALAMSPGEQKIDLVHIDDVVQAYLIAAQRLLDDNVTGHEVYGVATGKPISLKQLVTVVEEKTGKKINIEWGGRPYRDREVMDSFAPHENILYPEAMTDLPTGIKGVVKVLKS